VKLGKTFNFTYRLPIAASGMSSSRDNREEEEEGHLLLIVEATMEGKRTRPNEYGKNDVDTCELETSKQVDSNPYTLSHMSSSEH